MKRNFLFLIISILLFSCGPSQEEINAQIKATSDSKKTQIANFPTRTPWPTAAPDNRTPFEKCRDSDRNIRYVIQVTDGNVSGVSLTLENDTGGTDQADYKVPYCNTFKGFKSGDFLYISAQIVSGSGTIECLILDGSATIARATASGFPNIATCSGIAK